MARRAVIDREELFETANTLAAEGKDVTALLLLNALGGGSLTTIYKYLSEWEAGRPKTAPMAGATEIPDVVQNAFVSTWRVAAMEAARETAAVKEKAAEEVKSAHKQFEGALEAIQKLETESENDAAQIEALKTRVSELEAALSATGNDNAALKATGEQLRHQVKSQQAELDRLHKDRDEDRKMHQDEQARAKAEHAAAQDKTNAQLERLGEQLAAAQKNADQADRARSESQFKFEQAEKQIADAGQRLQAAEQKRDAAGAEREAAIKEAAELKGQAEALKAQNAELMARLTTVGKEKRKPE